MILRNIVPYAIRNKISFIKNEMLSDAELDKFFNTDFDKLCVEVYYKYQKILEESNVVDFDDLLSKTCYSFSRKSRYIRRISRTFSIHLD